MRRLLCLFCFSLWLLFYPDLRASGCKLLLSFEVLSLLLRFMSRLWEQNLGAKDLVA